MSAAAAPRQPFAIYWPFGFAAVLSPAIGLALVAWNSWVLGCPDRVRHAVMAGLTTAFIVAANVAWFANADRMLSASGVTDMDLARDFYVIGLKVAGMAVIAAITVAQTEALRFRFGTGGSSETRVRVLLKIVFGTLFALIALGIVLKSVFAFQWGPYVLRPLFFLR